MASIQTSSSLHQSHLVFQLRHITVCHVHTRPATYWYPPLLANGRSVQHSESTSGVMENRGRIHKKRFSPYFALAMRLFFTLPIRMQITPRRVLPSSKTCAGTIDGSWAYTSAEAIVIHGSLSIRTLTLLSKFTLKPPMISSHGNSTPAPQIAAQSYSQRNRSLSSSLKFFSPRMTPTFIVRQNW